MSSSDSSHKGPITRQKRLRSREAFQEESSSTGPSLSASHDTDDDDDDDESGSFVVGDDTKLQVFESEDELSDKEPPQKETTTKQKKKKAKKEFNHAAELNKHVIDADAESEELASFYEEDDFLNHESIRLNDNRLALRKKVTELVSAIAEDRMVLQCELDPFLDEISSSVTEKAFSIITDEEAFQMYLLIKEGWHSLRNEFLRETFHGKLTSKFLGEHLNLTITTLFDFRQFGGRGRANLEFLRVVESRRDRIFEAVLDNTCSLTRFSEAEHDYSRRARQHLRQFVGDNDKEDDLALPRASSADGKKRLQNDSEYQLALRRMTCDACQNWQHGHRYIELVAVLQLARSAAECIGNFDFYKEKVEGDGAEDDSSLKKGQSPLIVPHEEEEEEEEEKEEPCHFLAPKRAVIRGSRNLYICTDCCKRCQYGMEIFSFLRKWTSRIDFLQLDLSRSLMRDLCRSATVVIRRLQVKARRECAKTLHMVED